MCRTSSRKSAPIFTNKRRRRLVRAQGHNRDPKRSRAAALKKAPVNPKATSLMLSSRSWTKTRKSNDNLPAAVARATVAGSTKKQNQKEKIEQAMATGNVKPLRHPCL